MTARILAFTPASASPPERQVRRATIIPFPGALPPRPEAAPAASPARRKRGLTQDADDRVNMLAKIHLALAELYRRARTEPDLAGFCEDVYRYKLREDYGHDSAAKLDNRQLNEVLQWLRSLGWKPRKGRNRRAAPATLTHDATGMRREARMEKIEALLAEKGRAEGTDMPWGYAVSILKRQTAHDTDGRKKRFEDATPSQLDDVIAALYRDAKRKGRRVR